MWQQLNEWKQADVVKSLNYVYIGFNISETADLLGFSCTTVSRVCIELKKQETTSQEQFCGQKGVVNERSEEKGQTGQSWQEGDSNANIHTLQCRRASLNTQYVKSQSV